MTIDYDVWFHTASDTVVEDLYLFKTQKDMFTVLSALLDAKMHKGTDIMLDYDDMRWEYPHGLAITFVDYDVAAECMTFIEHVAEGGKVIDGKLIYAHELVAKELTQESEKLRLHPCPDPFAVQDDRVAGETKQLSGVDDETK